MGDLCKTDEKLWFYVMIEVQLFSVQIRKKLEISTFSAVLCRRSVIETWMKPSMGEGGRIFNFYYSVIEAVKKR